LVLLVLKEITSDARILEHRKTKVFRLNLEKTMDFLYKTTQEKSSPTVGVCRFHEFLPVGPITALLQGKLIQKYGQGAGTIYQITF
jgi:hypothetical protein